MNRKTKMTVKLFLVEFDIQKAGVIISPGHHSREVRAETRQQAIDNIHAWCRDTYGCHAFHCKASVVKHDAG